jgi:SNF2 family DNA or RNA helicase
MKLLTSLLPHQEEAFEKLRKLKAGALFMEQGTGKTRTTLELVRKRLDAGKADVVLWLCPCSVKKNLKEDIIYHCGEMPENLVIRGIESLSSSDRLYLMLLKLVNTHKVFLVVDESSLTKNPDAIRTERIISLADKCRYRLILNGTPISRNEADLYSQFYILDWRILGYRSYWSFAANHLEFRTIRLPNGREITDRSRIDRVLNIDYLTEKIAPYTYQIRKDECLKLPQKIYHAEIFRMTAEQDEEYDRVEQEFLAQVDEMKSETIYRLFTACQHVSSGRRITSDPEKRMETASIFQDPRDNPRIQALLGLASSLGGEKAIIFCKYQHEVSDILTLLPDGVEFTGRISQVERQRNREAFRRDAQFLVANKTCGAFGLNLQFCHNVIFYNNDFNLATRLQAEDRVHRLGQDHDVHVYDIICPDSIDGFISDCLNRKANMAETFKERIKDVQREVQNKKWKKYTRKLTSLKPRSEGSVSSSKSSKTSI